MAQRPDFGTGLPVATLERSLDYGVRVSDKAFYVSPTRGQLGLTLMRLGDPYKIAPIGSQALDSPGYDLLAVVHITSRESQAVHWKSREGAVLQFLPLPYPVQ